MYVLIESMGLKRIYLLVEKNLKLSGNRIRLRLKSGKIVWALLFSIEQIRCLTL